MKQWSIGPGPAGALIAVGDPDNPIPTLIQNVDTINTVYLGETAAVNPSNPLESVPLLPGQSTISSGYLNVFAIAAAGQNVAVNTLRGFGSFFQPTNLSSLGGVAIYNTATAPTQPPAIPLNSLWFTPTGAIEQWNGTAWTTLTFNGQQIITANTITVSQLAAGIVYAGIVDGTVIQAGSFVGPDFVINNQGLFFYNGTPAHGNLKLAIASSGGTDAYSNPYTDNIASYSLTGGSGGYAQIATNATTGLPYLILEPPGFTHPSANPQVIGEIGNAGAANELTQAVLYSGAEAAWGGAGAAYVTTTSRSQDGTVPSSVSLNGDQTHCTPKDGNTYSLGRLCVHTTGTVTINTATAIPILSVNVQPGIYRLHIHMVCLTGGTALTSVFAINTGTATAGTTIGTERRGRASTSADVVRPINTSGLPGGNTLALNASELTTYEFEGLLTITGAGTLVIAATTSTSSYAIATGSYMELLNIQ